MLFQLLCTGQCVQCVLTTGSAVLFQLLCTGQCVQCVLTIGSTVVSVAAVSGRVL